jgi:hypothetical protein
MRSSSVHALGWGDTLVHVPASLRCKVVLQKE